LSGANVRLLGDGLVRRRARALGVEHRPPAAASAVIFSRWPRARTTGGKIPATVYEKQLDGEVATLEAAIEEARRLWLRLRLRLRYPPAAIFPRVVVRRDIPPDHGDAPEPVDPGEHRGDAGRAARLGDEVRVIEEPIRRRAISPSSTVTMRVRRRAPGKVSRRDAPESSRRRCWRSSEARDRLSAAREALISAHPPARRR
jgi:hypothetical protein